MIIMRDRKYRKYAIKVPLNLREIFQIDEWAREKIKEIKKKMAKFTIYFLISLLFAFKSFAENLSKVKIEGNKRISDETIKVYGDIVIGKIIQRKI